MVFKRADSIGCRHETHQLDILRKNLLFVCEVVIDREACERNVGDKLRPVI